MNLCSNCVLWCGVWQVTSFNGIVLSASSKMRTGKLRNKFYSASKQFEIVDLLGFGVQNIVGYTPIEICRQSEVTIYMDVTREWVMPKQSSTLALLQSKCSSIVVIQDT